MLTFKIDDYIDTKNLDKLAELYELLTDKHFTVKDTEINYRMVNHWDKMGLIRFGRASKEGNRKFSFVDFIWIKVVDELRNFGVKLPFIKNITEQVYAPIPLVEMTKQLLDHADLFKHHLNKEQLVEFIKAGKDARKNLKENINFNYLQALIIEAIAEANLVSLVIFEDGEFLFYIKNKEAVYPKEVLDRIQAGSQVRISLSNIIYKHITGNALLHYTKEFKLFNAKEIKVLDVLNEGNYKKISVLFKTRTSEPLEIKKSKTTIAEITEIIRQKEYRDFVITDKHNKELRLKDLMDEEARLLKEREELFALAEQLKAGNDSQLKIVK
jgi:DNA-binding transcriptional MerR regulator